MVEAAKALGLEVAPLFFLDQPPPASGIWRWFLTESGLETCFESRPELMSAPFTLSLSPLRLNPAGWDARYKTLSYLTHVQAREQVSTDEAVLCNTQEQVATASMANLFWVRQGRLYTPDVICGCRRGIVRRWILENAGMEVETGCFPLETLDLAEEIFLTNSWIGVMPVRQWNARPLPTGPITSRLWKAYEVAIR